MSGIWLFSQKLDKGDSSGKDYGEDDCPDISLLCLKHEKDVSSSEDDEHDCVISLLCLKLDEIDGTVVRVIGKMTV